MKELFREYYPLTDDEVRKCVVDGTIVLDTNVLLGLYRFSTAEREQLLDVLAKAQERLWIPYQVAEEYQRNRTTVVNQQAGYYDSLVSLVGAPDADAKKKKLSDWTLPAEVRQQAEELLDRYLEAASEAAAPFVADAETLRAAHVVTREQALKDDPVRERLDTLLSGSVGAAPSKETRAEHVKTALDRFKSEVPPGFKDQSKESDEQKAGDYLLWVELLEFASTLNGDSAVLFVTQDVKVDWFQKNGQPLPALRREFSEHSEATYHQVSLEAFLRLANRHLQADVPEETIVRAHTFRTRVPTDLSGRHAHTLQHTLSTPAQESLSRMVEQWQSLPPTSTDSDRAALRRLMETMTSSETETASLARLRELAGSQQDSSAAYRRLLQQLAEERARQGSDDQSESTEPDDSAD